MLRLETRSVVRDSGLCLTKSVGGDTLLCSNHHSTISVPVLSNLLNNLGVPPALLPAEFSTFSISHDICSTTGTIITGDRASRPSEASPLLTWLAR